MITVQLTGGLGNQMFQYACAVATAIRLKTKLQYYHVSSYNDTPRKLEIQCLLVRGKILSLQEKKSVEKKIKLQILMQKYVGYQLPFLPDLCHERKLNYDRTIFSAHSNSFLIGYWQSEKYFKKIEKKIRTYFTFKKKLSGLNKKIATHINNCNSVSIHIRRGDYVSNQNALSFHGVPSLQYYKNAIAHINKNVEKPTYFVFSDDLNWVKENLQLFSAQYIDINNSPEDAYKDMQLMSICKHNIIANSTFSWWGAWLNNNREKIVIAPKEWFAAEQVNITDRFPRSWILL